MVPVPVEKCTIEDSLPRTVGVSLSPLLPGLSPAVFDRFARLRLRERHDPAGSHRFATNPPELLPGPSKFVSQSIGDQKPCVRPVLPLQASYQRGEVRVLNHLSSDAALSQAPWRPMRLVPSIVYFQADLATLTTSLSSRGGMQESSLNVLATSSRSSNVSQLCASRMQCRHSILFRSPSCAGLRRACSLPRLARART